MNFYEERLEFLRSTIGNCRRVLSLDLETLVRDGKFLQGERIIAVSATTMEGKTRIFVADRDEPEEEYRILREFNDLLREYKPEIILGFNHTSYDIPLIHMNTRNIEKSKQLWDMKFYLATSFVVDMMYVCAMDLFSSTGEYRIRSLRNVEAQEKYSGLNLKRKKDTVRIDGMDVGQAIEMLWKEQRGKFLEYCEGDTADLVTLYRHIMMKK